MLALSPRRRCAPRSAGAFGETTFFRFTERDERGGRERSGARNEGLPERSNQHVGYICVMQLKHLRVLTTILFAFAVAQAGLGSGYLGGQKGLLIAHATNAFAVLVLTVLSAIFGFAYRRAGGPSWIFYFPLLLVLVVGVQMTLGFAQVKGAHIFLGVLFLCAVTMLCSYTWRLTPIEPAVAEEAPETAV